MYTHIYTMKVSMMWADTSETGGDYVDEVVDGEGVEGLPACRGTDGIAAGDAGRNGEGLRKEIGDTPLDERHPGVVDLRLVWHGCEVVDDHNVVISNNHLAIIIESMRHVAIFRKQYKSTRIAAKWREKR